MIPTLSSLVAPEVVVTTTSGVASDDKVGILVFCGWLQASSDCLRSQLVWQAPSAGTPLAVCRANSALWYSSTPTIYKHSVCVCNELGNYRGENAHTIKAKLNVAASREQRKIRKSIHPGIVWDRITKLPVLSLKLEVRDYIVRNLYLHIWHIINSTKTPMCIWGFRNTSG